MLTFGYVEGVHFQLILAVVFLTGYLRLWTSLPVALIHLIFAVLALVYITEEQGCVARLGETACLFVWAANEVAKSMNVQLWPEIPVLGTEISP